jgi:hypothetical protein
VPRSRPRLQDRGTGGMLPSYTLPGRIHPTSACKARENLSEALLLLGEKTLVQKNRGEGQALPLIAPARSTHGDLLTRCFRRRTAYEGTTTQALQGKTRITPRAVRYLGTSLSLCGGEPDRGREPSGSKSGACSRCAIIAPVGYILPSFIPAPYSICGERRDFMSAPVFSRKRKAGGRVLPISWYEGKLLRK